MFNVNTFVLSGFPIDGYPNTHSITALIIAIRRSDLTFIKILIELGCDVNCCVRSYTIIPLLEAYQICKYRQDNLSLFEVRLWYVSMNSIYKDLFSFSKCSNRLEKTYFNVYYNPVHRRMFTISIICVLFI